MSLFRVAIVVLLLALVATGLLLLRAERSYRPVPREGTAPAEGVSQSAVHPGGPPPPEAGAPDGYEETAFAISQGETLYRSFNCNGCHASGGGSIGPALMDDRWIYGSAPRAIVQTIVEGRPNGMPAFRGRIDDAQANQLAAYVRSLGGLVPSVKRPARDDHLSRVPPATRQGSEVPKEGGVVPPAGEHSQ